MKKFSTTNRWLEKIEEKNVTIALNFCLLKKEKNYPAYVSKHNSNREKQVVILLMIQTQKTETMTLSCSKMFFTTVKRNNVKS